MIGYTSFEDSIMRRDALLRRLSRLKMDVHGILGNKLSLAKVCLSLVRTRKLTDSQIQNGEDSIDEAIKRVDAQIGELIDEIENE